MRSLSAAALLCATLCACSTTGPRYQSSIDNVQELQRIGPAKIGIGTVKLDETRAESLNRLSARGTSVDSPYGGYAEYLKEAIRADLTTAGKYDPQARNQVNAVLTENQLDASGARVGEAKVAARFSVVNGAAIRYEKQHSVTHRWESSFLGGVAIPSAVQNYAAAVQKLLGRLFADPEFKAAIRE
jgi:curli biogenesis system outer membrane secretion channel CsgG